MDLEAALKLFDETTGALAAQVRRLEGVLAQKQAELVEANRQLAGKVAELDRLAAWLELVMGAVASGVLAVDREGRISTCNAAAVRVLRPVLGDPAHADYRAAFPGSPLLQVLEDGRPAPRYERRVRGGDGRERILSCSASPLVGPGEVLLGAVEVFEDVTGVRELEERAERADRLKRLGEMAAGVAHEIRNPLNGIEGFASLLAKDFAAGAVDPQRGRRYAEAIVGGVRDLNRTVSGLLEFTRSRRLEPRPCPPGELAAAVVELLRVELAGDGGPAIALELEDRWDGGPLTLDPGQLRQVLLNLLQNAVHALREREDRPPGGRVRLGLERDGRDGFAFLVDDDGPGVPAEERQRIFTPFYTTRAHGTGLGLAVAHTIVALHGGALTAEAAPLGGARFRVRLPA